ncbi:DEAD/DEAH box helicase [Novosphingobium sp. BW1]|uniref:DEAD/DEAH box helicase n=1 Tax=Novosphingobium sp. BW1 TaxID=2592621 RepID=UPI0011DECD96|nr:DEAD/DEAH box helicase [Novosphingobium sp. BW1]TYC83812.1 DEAD/DEAH box helicase [Novosphingobium sp. BW1]
MRTTSLSISASETSSYDRLHPEIRRWVRDEGWTGLREIQDMAIRCILGSSSDVIIMAGTASGKTEAAFLPLLTQAANLSGGGLRLLYISPLKALINDQFRRLEPLCDRLDMPITRWHGDAPQGAKARLLRNPAGLALITPESIEALLLRRPAEATKLFLGVQGIIVDELHAFLQGPRGLHLASLLRRVDRITGARPRRVGLSATLGDADAACRWMDAVSPETVAVLRAPQSGPGVRLQIRGYEEPPEGSGVDDIADDGANDALSRIANHIFANLRGSNNLVFAASRRTVEALADRLRERSEKERVPEEFFPHHGSLSKELRETLETRLKAGDQPTTAVATTTLELGIDLGSVQSVAQVGAPRSLAGLKQRLGRSGRRGSPAVLRIYVRERHLDPDSDPLDKLRLETVRAVACVRLLQQNWVEPSTEDSSLATVALHQTLSLIASGGGVRPAAAHKLLFGRDSYLAFAPSYYADLLRGAGRQDVGLLEQSPDGILMLGQEGERLVQGRDFYAVFSTDEEWRLVSAGRTLGTVPLTNVLGIGSLVGFAGRRWRVEAVDDRAKVLEVVPHRSGKLPRFDRPANEQLHDRLTATMREVLSDSEIPAYLDATSRDFLEQGRTAYRNLALDRTALIPAARDTHVVSWRGTALNSVLSIVLMSAGLEVEVHDLGVTAIDTTPEELTAVLQQAGDCPSMDDLSEFVLSLRTAKLDDFVDEILLRRLWAVRNAKHQGAVTSILNELRRSVTF